MHIFTNRRKTLSLHDSGSKVVHSVQTKTHRSHQISNNRDGGDENVQMKQRLKDALKLMFLERRKAATDRDPQFKRLVRKLVSASGQLGFERLIDHVKTFFGWADDGRAEDVENPELGEYPREIIAVSGRHTLEKITTSEFLQAAGSRLQNCFGDLNGPGGNAHRELREGTHEFWLLSKRSIPLAVIPVFLLGREIGTCLGQGDTIPYLSQRIALTICEKLDATGDESEAFVRAGAYQLFMRANITPDALEFFVDGRLLTVWVNESELVIRERKVKSGKEYWSRFQWINGTYSSTWYSQMEVQELLTLVTKFDVLRNALNEVHSNDEHIRTRKSSAHRFRIG